MTFFAVRSKRSSVARSRFPKMQGFTLIELMIVVVILAIFLALAAPSMGNLVRDQRVKTAVGDVYAVLAFARSEAIKRNCNVDIISGGDWASGWTIRTTYPCDSTALTLKAQDALEGLNITRDDGSSIGNISYQGDGRLTAVAPVILVKSSQSTSVTARCVRVDLSGRPNIKVDTNGNPSDGCN